MLQKATIRPYVFLSLLFLPALLSFNTKENILGYWEVTRVLKSGEVSSNSRNKYLVFSSDYRMLSGTTSDGYPTQSGQWTYDTASRSLSIQSDEKNRDDGDYLVIRLNANEMVLSKGEVLIFLDRGTD